MSEGHAISSSLAKGETESFTLVGEGKGVSQGGKERQNERNAGIREERWKQPLQVS